MLRIIVLPLIVIFAAMLAFLFLTGWVTTSAIAKIRYAFFTMLVLNLGRIMLMAPITCIGLQLVRVADPALTHSTLSMVDGKSVRAFINSG